MLTDIDNITKTRLIYVKKLYLHGHEHAQYGTEFDRMIAIHHFDNTVELLLKCVATKYNVSFKGLHVKFPDLWNAVDKESSLPKKTEMFNLHNFRSNVQHWGVSPFSSEVINRFDVYVLDFVREVLEEVFGLDFEELFMSSLVEDKTLTKILTIAEKAFERRDYKKCIRFADAAFNRALEQREEELGMHEWIIPSKERELPVEIVEPVSILKLGIDYGDYKKYTKFAPHARWNEDKEDVGYPRPLYEIAYVGGGEELEKKVYSRENALFSLNFVLDCILRWHL